MNRREFTSGLLLPLFAPVARAQPTARIPRVAFAVGFVPATMQAFAANALMGLLLEELKKRGYIDGKTARFEPWSAEGNFSRFPTLAAGVVASAPDIIFASSTEFALELRKATSTIPMIATVYDAIAYGFASSLARPGGNVSGYSYTPGLHINVKVLEIVKELVPQTLRVGRLGPKGIERLPASESFRTAARQTGMTMIESYIESPFTEEGCRRAFEALRADGVGAIMLSAAVDLATVQLVAKVAAETRMPTTYYGRAAAAAGGLVAYSFGSDDEAARICAEYIDRVLKGANPGDLPFQQATAFRLLINMKAAKELGITLPPALLARADEVIE